MTENVINITNVDFNALIINSSDKYLEAAILIIPKQTENKVKKPSFTKVEKLDIEMIKSNTKERIIGIHIKF